MPQNQSFWHSGNAGKILAGTMYQIEGQFNVWWPNFGRQEVWQMPTKTTVVNIVPAKISPALPLYQKNWFCGKVRLDDFYLLLRSIASNCIHIGAKRISQACCLHHLKNMEKIVKHNFGMKNKIGDFFIPHCTLYICIYIYIHIYI